MLTVNNLPRSLPVTSPKVTEALILEVVQNMNKTYPLARNQVNSTYFLESEKNQPWFLNIHMIQFRPREWVNVPYRYCYGIQLKNSLTEWLTPETKVYLEHYEGEYHRNCLWADEVKELTLREALQHYLGLILLKQPIIFDK